jgi:cytochrome c oxidase subunit 2
MRTFKAAVAILGSGLLCVLAEPALAEWAVNLPRGVSPISQEVYRLHMIIFWICVVIGVAVFGVMFWSIFHHRKSRGAKPATFHENHVVEIVWTIIPFFILIGMAVPAAKTLIEMEDTRNADVTIKVTGYQWMWNYEYMDEGITFFSRLDSNNNKARQLRSGIDPFQVPNYLLDVDKPLVLPVNKKIRILTTANDVIHAWWVPELGGKKDAIPGYINEMWTLIQEPGIYRGQCAELCGKDHAYMPIVVRAVSEEEYARWLAEQKAPAIDTQAAAL